MNQGMDWKFYHCPADPVSSDVEQKYSLEGRESLTQAHRNSPL